MGQVPSQPTPGQPTMSQTQGPTVNQPAGQGRSNVIWYVIGAAVVIAAALGVWYFYGVQSPAPVTAPIAVEQAQTPAVEQAPSQGVTTGNTTVDIANDLNQTPDASAALDADAAASAQTVSGL